jgi:hypothetical protein
MNNGACVGMMVVTLVYWGLTYQNSHIVRPMLAYAREAPGGAYVFSGLL